MGASSASSRAMTSPRSKGLGQYSQKPLPASEKSLSAVTATAGAVSQAAIWRNCLSKPTPWQSGNLRSSSSRRQSQSGAMRKASAPVVATFRSNSGRMSKMACINITLTGWSST